MPSRAECGNNKLQDVRERPNRQQTCEQLAGCKEMEYEMQTP